MIKKFLFAFIIKAPIALSVFYISVKQNKLFDTNNVLLIGSILSSSVLFSILFLQPLGNIYNKAIGQKEQYKINTFKDNRFLVLFLIIVITSLSLLLHNQFKLVISLNLATSQALYQWCISYLTVKKKTSQLFILSFILPIELILISFFFNFEFNSVYTWLNLMIASYYIPSILIFIFNLKFDFEITNKWIFLKNFLKSFLSSATFFTVLSILFWMLEFYPRKPNIFDESFTGQFNVYITFSIGLVGAIDIILGQVFLEKYLKLAASSKLKLKLFFYQVFKLYISIFILVTILMSLLNRLYWPLIFDKLRFNNVKFFIFIFILESLRILCFQTFNIFFYLNEVKKIKNNILIFITSIFILYLSNIYFNISGNLYLISYGIISIIIIILNYKSLDKIT